MANKTGQTKRLLKLLNSNDCCIECPAISQDPDNILECREDGLYATALTEVPEPVLENPFTNLRYQEASLYINRFFKHKGNTITHQVAWPTLIGDGVSFTIASIDLFADGGMYFGPAAGDYTITWPTAANIKLWMQIATQGAWWDWVVVNDGTDTVTFVLNTGLTISSALTGGDDLVVAAGTTAVFRFVARTGGNSYTVARIA